MLTAYAQGAPVQAGAQGNPLMSLMPIIVIFVIFYFLLIRPQKKAQADHKKLISELKKNDEIITSGGIHGTIVNVKDNTLVLKIDDNVKMEIQKSSVGTIKKSRQA
ncbi:MAG: preprotein translocase subunit YajC [Omnitrophica bacterium]|nr:preprotein translocase subunit YajC [Candidatus Omnitrophota bacterium]